MQMLSLPLRLLWLLWLLGLSEAQPAEAAELMAVVHPLNPAIDLTQKDVRKLFIGTTRYWGRGDVNVIPYVRPESTPAGATLMVICKISRARYDSLWTRRQLAGQGVTPQELASAEDVLAMVATDPRAIGVISVEEAGRMDTAGVKVIAILDR